MIPLVKLKEDLKFSGELQDMVEVLKGATSSQFRSLQARRKHTEPFKDWLEDFLRMVEVPHESHIFLKEQQHLPKLVVIMTSDEGFLGGLNTSIVETGLEQAGGQDELLVLGERGARYLEEVHSSAFIALPGIEDDITYERAVTVRDLILDEYRSKRLGLVLVVYARFLSFTHHRVDVIRLLPCPQIFGSKKAIKRVSGHRPEILLEPSPGGVVSYLAKAWMMQRLYEVFWESKLSECAARIIHLEGSHEEIRNVNKGLTYEYFKSMHSLSDRNIREIFAARLRWQKGGDV